MSLFPKSKRKSIPVFNRGGSVNPFGGLVVDYVPTAPDITDINAVRSLAQFNEDQRASHEKYRESKKITMPMLAEAVSKMEGTEADKKQLIEGLRGRLSEYNKARQGNIDFWLSQEGVDATANLASMMGPEVAQRMKDTYTNLVQNQNIAKQKGTIDYHVIDADGKYSILDADGNVQKVSANELQELRKKDKTIAPLTAAEMFQLAGSKDSSLVPSTSGMRTSQDAQQYIEDTLTRATGLNSSVNLKSLSEITTNWKALEHAKNQILSQMSPEDKNALRTAYAKETGDFSDAAFEKMLKRDIHEAAMKRKVYKEDANAALIRAANGSGGTKKEVVDRAGSVPIGPTAVKFKEDSKVFPASDQKYFVTKQSLSPVPEKKRFEKQKIFNQGTAVVLGDTDDIETSKKGNPVNQVQMFDRVEYKGIKTALQIVTYATRDPKTGNFSPNEKAQRDFNLFIPEEMNAEGDPQNWIEKDGFFYAPVKNQPNQFIQLRDVAVKEYDGYMLDEKGNPTDDGIARIVEKASAIESTYVLGANYTNESVGPRLFLQKEQKDINPAAVANMEGIYNDLVNQYGDLVNVPNDNLGVSIKNLQNLWNARQAIMSAYSKGHSSPELSAKLQEINFQMQKQYEVMNNEILTQRTEAATALAEKYFKIGADGETVRGDEDN